MDKTFQKLICLDPTKVGLEKDKIYYGIECKHTYRIFLEQIENKNGNYIGEYSKSRFWNQIKWRDEQIDSIFKEDKPMRYYTEISKENFLKEVQEVMDNEEFPYEVSKSIEKDLSKVNFDWENYTCWGDTEGCGYPTGYKELEPEFHIYLAAAGGDWEHPVCYIFYWGDGELRAYIPKDGNVWNKKENCAYGSEHNAVEIDWAAITDQINKEFSEEKLYADIKRRIIKK